jgi:hypothetical protein
MVDNSKIEFKAELKNDKLIIKPFIERKGKDLIIHLPSFKLMNKIKKDHKKK